MEYLSPAFKRITNTVPRFKNAINEMKGEIDDFMKSFHDDPSSLSGWGHRYFCNEDGGRLIFDPKKPHEHVCSVCGRVYKDKVYDESWVYFYRNLAILTALKSAAVYRSSGEEKYKGYALSIISFYADNYTAFAIHTKEGDIYKSYDEMKWGGGRILPQGLNESIIAIRIIQALELLKDELSSEFKKNIHDRMFSEFYKLIMPQVDAVHNIRCWNLAALGTAALFFGDGDVLDFIYRGEYSIHRQIREGVTADKFWYEGSIHYNYFLLEGIMTFLVFCKVYGSDFGEDEKVLSDMLVNGYKYAFSNDRFPDPNDGWPDLNLKTYSYIYHMGAKCWGQESSVGNILKLIESDGTKRTGLPLSESYYTGNGISLEYMMFNPDLDVDSAKKVERTSYNYPGSDFAMLRADGMEVFLKYGLNGPSHAHPDIMNTEISLGDVMLSRDLSNAGYYSRMCIEWHRMTISHNTVCVGGENIPSVDPGRTLMFSQSEIVAENRNVYPDVDYLRHLIISSNTLSDSFRVASKTTATKDWFFHLESDFTVDVSGLSFSDAHLGYEKNGYQFLENVRKVECGRENVKIKAVSGRRSVTLTFNLADGQELYFCRTMDNPVTSYRTTFIIRAKEMITEFNLSISMDQEE